MGGKREDPQDDLNHEAEVRERDLVEAYVQEHELEASLNEVINQVVADRPADPFLVLASLLFGRATSKRGIFHVECKEILDSYGLPGILVRLHTGKGVFDASCGSRVAGLQDRPESFDEFAPSIPLNKQRFGGQGYKRRAARAQALLVEKLVGVELTDQETIDSALLLLESDIGRNFCLAASIAACKAGAKYADLPLHEYIAKLHELPLENVCIPMPLFSVVNAGRLASNKLYIEDIFVSPVSATSFADAYQLGAELCRSIHDQLEARSVGFSNVGAFGGFAPQLQSIAETFQILRAAVEDTRMRMEGGGGPESLLLDAASIAPLRFEFGIDFAASHFVTPPPPPPVDAQDVDPVRTTFTYNTDKWVPGSQGVIMSSDEMLAMVRSCVNELDVVSVVDPFDGGDVKAFAALMGADDAAADEEAGETEEAGRRRVLGGDPHCRLQVVASDLVEVQGLETIQEERAANTILLQLDQYATITRALEVVSDARRYGLALILGAGSGQADATGFLEALAVGTGIGQVKFGGLRAAECVDRYNRLMLLAEDAVPPAFVGTAYRR